MRSYVKGTSIYGNLEGSNIASGITLGKANLWVFFFTKSHVFGFNLLFKLRPYK